MYLSADKIKSLFPEKEKKIREFFIILYSVGVIGTAIPFTRQIFIYLTPLILIISIFILAVFHSWNGRKKDWMIFASIFIISFTFELAGVNTGFPFGNYSYGQGLGIRICNTPVLIGLNWVLLVYCTGSVLERTKFHDVIKVTAASAMMVVYDLIMEQVAPLMDMWSFEKGVIPIQNYISWFILSVIFHTVIKLSGISLTNKFAPLVFWCQTVFFTILMVFFILVK